tara:strand:- start:2159 stop:2356 length:198 start_codon:yes stop_codon:yes gene_type:complete
MTTIELDAPWTYRTPEKTINYPAGKHEVFQYIADQAEAEGAITKKEEADGDADAKSPRKRARKAE